jgi:hypothetical protein
VATDREFYDHLRYGHYEWFGRVMDRLVESWIGQHVRYVVCDAADGHNSGHDACRLLATRAARICRLPLFELPLTEQPNVCPAELAAQSIWVQLDASELAEKLAVARAYAALADELEAALEQFGSVAFCVECLRAVESLASLEAVLPLDPWYERYGARQVQAGHYPSLITRNEHLVPLARFLEARSWGGTA